MNGQKNELLGVRWWASPFGAGDNGIYRKSGMKVGNLRIYWNKGLFSSAEESV